MSENESITQYLRGWLSYEGYDRFSEAWYIADRIDACFTHELEAKQEEVDGLRSDNAKLQAKLDASIPVPVDADGVPWTGSEDEFIADTDERCRLLGVMHSVEGGDFLEVDDGSGRYFIADACRHVAPEPPEPPDSQERIDADAKKGACDYFGHSNTQPCDGCPAYDGATRKSCMILQKLDLLRRQRELDGAGEKA